MTTAATMHHRSLEVYGPVVGLVYSGIFVIFVSTFESPPVSGSNPFPLIADIFAAVFFLSAFLIRRGGRAGYLIAIPLCIFFGILFSSDLTSALTGFADLSTFLQSITFVPILLLTLAYCILGLRVFWRRGEFRTLRKFMPASAAMALFVGGFVVGGSLIGGLASGVESRLLANYGGGEDVMIVFGASNHYSGGLTYSPANYTVKVGVTVVWVNKDTATHTVTSLVTHTFDSGDMPTGAKFSFTFTQPGTYRYFCTYHTFMTGTITVTT